MDELLTALPIMAVITYLSRYALIPLLAERRLGPKMSRYFSLIPFSVLAALAIANLTPPGQTAALPELVGAGIAVLTAWLGRNLLLTIVVAVIITALLRAWL